MCTGEKVRVCGCCQKGAEKGFVFNDFQVPSAQPERAGRLGKVAQVRSPVATPGQRRWDGLGATAWGEGQEPALAVRIPACLAEYTDK